MMSWRESEWQATGNPDEAVLETSYTQTVMQVPDAPHKDDKDRCLETCMVCTEDEKLTNDSIISDNILQLKEPCSSFLDQDYVEKLEEFQFYVDMVKEIARPGCSPETLNVALSSMSSLVKALSVMSSKQYIHASL